MEDRCDSCGQFDFGQTGEYPCQVCGLPVTWDDVVASLSFDVVNSLEHAEEFFLRLSHKMNYGHEESELFMSALNVAKNVILAAHARQKVDNR